MDVEKNDVHIFHRNVFFFSQIVVLKIAGSSRGEKLCLWPLCYWVKIRKSWIYFCLSQFWKYASPTFRSSPKVCPFHFLVHSYSLPPPHFPVYPSPLYCVHLLPFWQMKAICMNLFECMIPMMIYIVSIIHVSGYSRIIHVKQNISMDKNVEL
jgi:hypothetical protein